MTLEAVVFETEGPTALEAPEKATVLGPTHELSLRSWTASDRDLRAAERLLARCVSDLGWLCGMLAESMTAALVEAYDTYPELGVAYPRQELADAMAAVHASGVEQALSHLVLARLVDPTPERTLAILIAGLSVMDAEVYQQEVQQWLATDPAPASVIRLMRALDADSAKQDRLEVIGLLSAAGTSQPSLLTQIIGGFGSQLTKASDADEENLPRGEALIRARQAIRAQARESGTRQDLAGPGLAMVSRIRALLQESGYNAARPPVAQRGRTIDNPSWIGGWSEYISRKGSGCLRATYFESDHARRDPLDGSLVANQASPYELARSRPIEMPSGRFHVDFHGEVEGETLLRCEVTGFTGRRGRHCLGAATLMVQPNGSSAVLGTVDFALDERAAEVVFSVYVQKPGGAVGFASIDLRKMND